MKALLGKLLNLIETEPVVVGYLAAAIVALAARFGLHWSSNTVVTEIIAAAGVIAALVRSKVTPTASVPQSGAQVPQAPEGTDTGA